MPKLIDTEKRLVVPRGRGPEVGKMYFVFSLSKLNKNFQKLIFLFVY